MKLQLAANSKLSDRKLTGFNIRKLSTQERVNAQV